MNTAKHLKTAPALTGNLSGLENASGSKNTKWKQM